MLSLASWRRTYQLMRPTEEAKQFNSPAARQTAVRRVLACIPPSVYVFRNIYIFESAI